jgi:hypothetical protein
MASRTRVGLPSSAFLPRQQPAINSLTAREQVRSFFQDPESPEQIGERCGVASQGGGDVVGPLGAKPATPQLEEGSLDHASVMRLRALPLSVCGKPSVADAPARFDKHRSTVIIPEEERG